MLDDRLQSLLEIVACEHDPMTACQAFEADVSSNASDLPIGSAARMRLLQPYDVANADGYRHLGLRIDVLS